SPIYVLAVTTVTTVTTVTNVIRNDNTPGFGPHIHNDVTDVIDVIENIKLRRLSVQCIVLVLARLA
ncbi:MAG: hypothetical protein IJ555_10150, partial [Ruminococcus sp.]|nr:hypothetical protein [Ruminococcus sp.]